MQRHEKIQPTRSLVNVYDSENTKWEWNMSFNKKQLIGFLKKIIIPYEQYCTIGQDTALPEYFREILEVIRIIYFSSFASTLGFNEHHFLCSLDFIHWHYTAWKGATRKRIWKMVTNVNTHSINSLCKQGGYQMVS